MTQKEATNLLEQAKEAYSLKDYETAIHYLTQIQQTDNPEAYLNAQLNLGLIYSQKEETEKEIECYNKVRKEDNPEAYAYAQWNLGLIYFQKGKTEKAIECYNKVRREDNPEAFAKAQFNLGIRYNQKGKTEKAIECYNKVRREDNPEAFAKAQLSLGVIYSQKGKTEKAIECYNKVIKEDNPKAYAYTQWNLGILYSQKGKIEKAASRFKEVPIKPMDCFLLLCKEEKAKELFSAMIKEQDDFFTTTLKNANIEEKEQEKYKDLFLLSLQIIAELHVGIDNGILEDNQRQVAHYTTKETAEKLLLKDSPIRLNCTITSNDPDEGQTLLDFLQVDKQCDKATTNEAKINPYRAFTACFTFDFESLNQFRLYGKENNQEATGLSLVLNMDFFNSQKELKVGPEKMPNNNPSEKEQRNEENHRKYSLYRCVYIDPQTRQVISIGQKEPYTLYRELQKKLTKEEIDKKVDEYQKQIDTTKKKVSDLFEQLFQHIEGKKKEDKLRYDVVCDLLLPLRFLVKHVAFKEEQECRIFSIENLKSSNKVLPTKESLDNNDTTTFDKLYIQYDKVSDYLKEVIFAPHVTQTDLFEAHLLRKQLNVRCRKSSHPYSIR